ncbi:MAG: hypothetical protein LBK99_16620 [Opitutaceae bacterium]|jgi:hypothetical protein|nr:hypothetical protein [Opitutaceae bacterium]
MSYLRVRLEIGMGELCAVFPAVLYTPVTGIGQVGCYAHGVVVTDTDDIADAWTPLTLRIEWNAAGQADHP